MQTNVSIRNREEICREFSEGPSRKFSPKLSMIYDFQLNARVSHAVPVRLLPNTSLNRQVPTPAAISSSERQALQIHRDSSG